MSLRDKILKTAALGLSEPLHIPEWDVSVRIKTFSLAEAQQFARASDSDEDEVFLAKGLALGLRDEKGDPIFAEDDIEAVTSLDNGVCVRLFREITDHNRVDEEDVKN